MNQDIKCNVNSCKFYTENHCNLNTITVGNDSLTGDARNNRETNCCSFSKK